MRTNLPPSSPGVGAILISGSLVYLSTCCARYMPPKDDQQHEYDDPDDDGEKLQNGTDADDEKVDT
ncbi:MAG: hypothetical protein H6559_37950 [Lewinellaceae bacterium]|nr:hypothetical protein [Lewinellaceae bacterium]